MKISSLLEAYKIQYDFTKKKNSSSIVDFIKLNNIIPADIDTAMRKAQQSAEYKKVIALGYEYKSSSLQARRATLYFETEDGNSQATCYATGQTRVANRGGYDNKQFMASPIPTLPPTQLGEKASTADVLLDNLKKSLQALINKHANRDTKKSSGMLAVEERMKKFGFPDGFKMYIENAEKSSAYLTMDEGQLMFNGKADGRIGNVVIDFGDNAELGPNIDFGRVEGIWKVKLRGNKIKSYKGLEKFFNSGLLVIEIDAKDPNLKELAKIMKAGVKYVYFISNPLEMPLLSVAKMAYENISMSKEASSKLINDPNIVKFMGLLNKVIKKDFDLFDVQDELIDAGFTVAAKQ